MDNNEQLRAENEKLRAENEELKERLVRLQALHDSLKSKHEGLELKYEEHEHAARFESATHKEAIREWEEKLGVLLSEKEKLKKDNIALKRDIAGLEVCTIIISHCFTLHQVFIYISTTGFSRNVSGWMRWQRRPYHQTGEGLQQSVSGLKSQVAEIPHIKASVSVFQTNFFVEQQKNVDLDDKFDDRELANEIQDRILREVIHAPLTFASLGAFMKSISNPVADDHKEALELFCTAKQTQSWLGHIHNYMSVFKSNKQ